MSDKKVNLRVVSPVIACDGNAMAFNPDGTVSVLFFQISTAQDKSVDATSVSILKFNLEQLEMLQQSIGDAIEEAKKRTKE